MLFSGERKLRFPHASGNEEPDDFQEKSASIVFSSCLRTGGVDLAAFFRTEKIKEEAFIMHKSSLFFSVHQEGSALPGEDTGGEVRNSVSECRALVRREPAPEWLILYRKIQWNK